MRANEKTRQGLAQDDPPLGEARLKRLAQRIGTSEHDVEDAAQDAALHALRAGPARPRSPAAWWSRVIHNRVLALQRERLRRRARERCAARGELQPSVVDALARAELMRDLAEELHGLTETDRAVLVMRYLDERPLHEVAREFGLPVETVRKRLARARERLRARLRSRWGAHWQASCLWFAVAPGEAARGGGPTLLPLIAMQSTKHWAAAVVAVLAVLTLTAFWLVAGPPRQVPPTESSPTAVAEASTGDGEAGQRRSDSGSRVPLEAAPPPVTAFLDLPLPARRFGFTGRVVDAETGEPVPRAAVHGSEEVGWIECDEHGRFTCLQETDWRRPVSFLAVAEDYVGATVGAHAAAPAQEVTLRLQRGEEVLVRVLGRSSDRPVAGVVVRLETDRGASLAQTGADGIASLAAVPAAGEGAEVPATIETVYGPVWGRRFTRGVLPGSGAVHDVVAEIYPREAVVRVVEAGTGDPIPDARCTRRVVPHGSLGRGVSLARLLGQQVQGRERVGPSDDGLWRFELPANEPYLDIGATAAGYHPGGVRIIATSPSGVHEVRLAKLLPQPVRVVAGGRSLRREATLELELITIDSISYTAKRGWVPGTGPRHPFTWNRVTRSFRTDAAGYGTIELPPRVPERVFVTARLPDGRSRSMGGLMRRDLSDGVWTFDVDPGRIVIPVRVQDPDGRPLADREVEVQASGAEGAVERATFLSDRVYELGLADSGRTDAEGLVELEILDLPGGDVRIRVVARSPDDGARAGGPIQQAAREGMTVTVEPPPDGRITGRVVPRVGGFPAEQWRVHLVARPIDGGPSQRAKVEQDGTFSVEGLVPGTMYRLEQRAALGIDPVEVEVGARGVEVTIPAIATLEVEIVDDLTNEPVHARLIGRAGMRPASAGYVPRTDGRATLGPEAADWVAVHCEVDGYEDARVEVEPGQRSVTVRMRRKQ